VLVPAWLLERLKIWVDVLKMLDEKISQAKAALARACSRPRPKGVGALRQMQLQGEVLDWHSTDLPKFGRCITIAQNTDISGRGRTARDSP
jgi:hypothetical protein